MSAGPDAKPLGEWGWHDPETGKQIPPSELPWFTCQDPTCGYHGRANELLVEDDDTNMYCPQCGLMNWWWD